MDIIPHFIAGAQVYAQGDHDLGEVFNPATGELARKVCMGGATEVEAAVNDARSHSGAYLLNFLVEKEDSVYPMIPAGSSLHEMIRRPGSNPLVERPDDL